MPLFNAVNMRAVSGNARYSQSLFCRQVGVAMVEMVAGLTLVGSAAALVLTQQQAAEDLALQTHAELTASAITRAVNLQQAKWAVSRNLSSPLYFGTTGIAMGIDANPIATMQDCKALWQQLVVPQPVLQGARRFWQIAPEASAGSVRCQFTYHHHKLPSVVVFYNTQTGATAFE